VYCRVHAQPREYHEYGNLEFRRIEGRPPAELCATGSSRRQRIWIQVTHGRRRGRAVTPETLDALRQAWEGELFGEALMRELAWHLTDAAAHSAELEAIARLERRMARALARLPGVAQEASAARAAAQARAIASRLTTWEAFLEASMPSLPLALERFRAIARPEGCQVCPWR